MKDIYYNIVVQLTTIFSLRLAIRILSITIARMIKRQAQAEITELLDEFPAVGVLGPRQIGKTTLAETVAASTKPQPIYLDLETPSGPCLPIARVGNLILPN